MFTMQIKLNHNTVFNTKLNTLQKINKKKNNIRNEVLRYSQNSFKYYINNGKQYTKKQIFARREYPDHPLYGWKRKIAYVVGKINGNIWNQGI